MNLWNLDLVFIILGTAGLWRLYRGAAGFGSWTRPSSPSGPGIEAGGAVQQWLVRKTEPGVLRREGYSGHRKGTRTRRRSGAYRQHFSFQLHEIPPQT